MNITHGACKRCPELYTVWKMMRHRCEDAKIDKYKDYGQRGIKVSPEWKDPNRFIDWAFSSGYAPGLQIDRINNDGDYCRSNCRWVTPRENSRNKRNTVYLTVGGERRCVAEWCEKLGVRPSTVYSWVRRKGREYAEYRLLGIA